MLADSNRELVVSAGGLPALIDMLKHPSAEVPFMQSAAAACICNLAANINSKEIIATSGALEVLVQVRSRAHVCSRMLPYRHLKHLKASSRSVKSVSKICL
jgi:hypothetical protein